MSVAAVTAATTVGTAVTTMTKSLCFVGTNSKKVEDGQIMRAPIVLAQAANGAKAFTQTDLLGANKVQAGMASLSDTAKTSKVLTNCGKVLKWLQSNVNPLITMCVGAKILMSDDKERALWEDGTGLGSMFAAEKTYKTIAKTNTAKNIFQKVENAGNKIFKGGKGGRAGKICAAVFEGLGFVAASIGAYSGGSKLGGAALDKVQENRVKRQANFRVMC